MRNDETVIQVKVDLGGEFVKAEALARAARTEVIGAFSDSIIVAAKMLGVNTAELMIATCQVIEAAAEANLSDAVMASGNLKAALTIVDDTLRGHVLAQKMPEILENFFANMTPAGKEAWTKTDEYATGGEMTDEELTKAIFGNMPSEYIPDIGIKAPIGRHNYVPGTEPKRNPHDRYSPDAKTRATFNKGRK